MLRIFHYIQFAACLTMGGGNSIGCRPPVSGAKDKLYLIPYDSILSIGRSTVAKKGKYVQITLKTGAKAYVYEGVNNSNVARAKFTPGKFAPGYTHEIDLVAFGVAPEDIAELEALNITKVVAVLEDNNGYVRVYGLNAGLKVTKNESDSASTDTGGANEGTLASTFEAGYADILVDDITDVIAGYQYDLVAARAAVEVLV